MEEQIEITCRKMNILSDINSSNCNSGALVIAGGMGVGNNLNVKKTIICDKLICDDFQCTTSGQDSLTEGLQTKLVDCTNINVTNDILLGTMKGGCNCENSMVCICEGIPMLQINRDYRFIEMNTESFSLNTVMNDSNHETSHDLPMINKKEILRVDNNKISLCGDIVMTQQVIKLNSIEGDFLPIDAYVTFVCLDNKDPVNKKLDVKNTMNIFFAEGTVKRIVLRKTKKGSNRNLTLEINDNKKYCFKDEDDYIEIMFGKNKWNYISGNIRSN